MVSVTADDSETGGEADPDAGAAQGRVHAQPPGDGEADRPVADQRDDQRHRRVAHAAQRGAHRDLRAVDELEQAGDDQEARGERQRRLVLGDARIEEQADDLVREAEEDDRRGRHEADGQRRRRSSRPCGCRPCSSRPARCRRARSSRG